MKIVTEKVVQVVKEVKEVIYNLPEEEFCYQRWNYREIVKVIPITLEEKGVVGYRFLYSDCDVTTHKKFWLNGIKDLFRDGVTLSEEEKSCVIIIKEVSEDINSKGNYLNKISSEQFGKLFNAFHEEVLEKAGIKRIKKLGLIK